MTPLSYKINNGPVLFATLEVIEPKVRQFPTTKPATK